MYLVFSLLYYFARMNNNTQSNFEDHQRALQEQNTNYLPYHPPEATSGLPLNPMQLSGYMKEDPSQSRSSSSLGPNMGNDLRSQQLQQLQHQLMMQQQQQMLQQQQQQPQANNQLLRSIMNQMPSYENPLQMRLLNNQSAPSMFHPSLLNEAQLLMQNNSMPFPGMNAGQSFSLPSPHELTLRDESRRMRGGVIEPFPEKLHRLLTEVEAIGLSDVISFIANGKAFAIHKPDKFFKEIVPKYFRQSRLSSFKRQLNLYGFELINTGPASGGYRHEMFVKDSPELCRRMRRVAIKIQANKQEQGEKEQSQESNSPLEEDKQLMNKDEGEVFVKEESEE